MPSFLLAIAVVLVVAYVLVSLAASALGPGSISSRRALASDWLSRFQEWYSSAGVTLKVLVAAFVLLVLVGVRSALTAGLAVAVVLLAFATAWLREFRFLMLLRDDVFPGRNDKLIWALLLIVLPPVGLWLFRSYRLAHWPETKAGDGKVASDLV